MIKSDGKLNEDDRFVLLWLNLTKSKLREGGNPLPTLAFAMQTEPPQYRYEHAQNI